MSDAVKKYHAAIAAQNEASWALDDALRELRAAEDSSTRAHYAWFNAHPAHKDAQRAHYDDALQRVQDARERVAERRPTFEAARAAVSAAYVYTRGNKNEPTLRGRAVGLV